MSQNSLNDFDPNLRQQALREEIANAGFPETGTYLNAHAHTLVFLPP